MPGYSVWTYLWVALACLVPVGVLYGLFVSQNFFELQGLWKGVTAGGPIGAYILLYWLTLRHMLKMREQPALEAKGVRKEERGDIMRLDQHKWTGHWEWESKDGVTEYEEVIELKQTGRHVSGTVEDADGQQTGFKGQVFGQFLTLYFVSTKRGRLSVGSVTLVMNAKGNRLAGYQTYFDLDDEKLQCTVYAWEPRGAAV